MHRSFDLLALIVSLSAFVEGHTAFTTFFVNGVSQGDGTCVRMNTAEGRVNFPIADIESDDMVCGQSGLTPVARTCPLQAGDTVSFEFRSGPGSDHDESIVYSHSGPCGVYMKQISSDAPNTDGSFPTQSPSGDGWFKIMYNDTDSADKWCTNRINETAEGILTTKIPSTVGPGYYLIRPELLALHAATNRDPQFYVGCAQVYITGGSGTAKPDTTSIPGYVKYSDEAMSWNLYNQTGANYPEYGPKLYQADTSSESISVTTQIPSSTTASPSLDNKVTSTVDPVISSTTEALISKASPTTSPAGDSTAEYSQAASSPTPAPHVCKHKNSRIKRFIIVPSEKSVPLTVRDSSSTTNPFSCPSDTVLELGNLCLSEVPHWQDTDKSMKNCWASQKACWATNDACWKGRSPAVSYQKGEGCDLWSQKCTAIGEACKNFVMEGPADEGKDITPKKATLNGYGVQG